MSPTMQIIIGCAVAAGLLVLFWVWKNRNKKVGSNVKGEDPSIDSGAILRSFRGFSPKGVAIYSFLEPKQGVVEAAERGIETTLTLIEQQYPNATYSGLNRYAMLILEPSPLCAAASIPSFTVGPSQHVGGNPYDQTGWDLDKRKGWTQMCVAGKFSMINSNDAGERLAVHIVNDVSAAEVGARYEAEHAALMEVDLGRFALTQFHTDGTGHPILGELSTAVGFSGQASPVEFTCGGAFPK